MNFSYKILINSLCLNAPPLILCKLSDLNRNIISLSSEHNKNDVTIRIASIREILRELLLITDLLSLHISNLQYKLNEIQSPHISNLHSTMLEKEESLVSFFRKEEIKMETLSEFSILEIQKCACSKSSKQTFEIAI